MLKDLISNISVTKALANAVRTADANGVTVDTQGYGSCVFSANVGASGDTLSGSVKAELELEHSDDGSSWSDCANADLSTAVTGTNLGTWAVIDDPAEDDVEVTVAYVGSKRYARAVLNLTGTHTNGIPVSIVAVLGHPHKAPIA